MASNTRPQFKHPIQSTAVANERDISFVPFENATSVSPPDSGAIQVRWHGVIIIVRKLLSLDEVQTFVRTVLERCWSGEAYVMEAVDFELRVATIVYYSNVMLSSNIDEVYEFVYGTDLYDTVVNYVNEGQLKAIKEAIDAYMK